MYRTGRILLILVVVFFLAASTALAGRGDEPCGRSRAVCTLAKAPAMVIKEIVLTEAAFSEHVRGVALNLGIVFVKGFLLRLPRSVGTSPLD
jgi:hypothetical protein